jgi:hypothetical protein
MGNWTATRCAEHGRENRNIDLKSRASEDLNLLKRLKGTADSYLKLD